jgi:hypothetical protein
MIYNGVDLKWNSPASSSRNHLARVQKAHTMLSTSSRPQENISCAARARTLLKLTANSKLSSEAKSPVWANSADTPYSSRTARSSKTRLPDFCFHSLPGKPPSTSIRNEKPSVFELAPSCFALAFLATVLSLPAQATQSAPVDPQKQEHQQQKKPDLQQARTGEHDAVREGVASSSRIQVLSPPQDLTVSSSSDCRSRVANVLILTKATDLKGPLLLAGALEDKNSSQNLPAQAFQIFLSSRDPSKCIGDMLADQPLPSSTPVSLSIKLRDDWQAPGNYSGTLTLIAPGDSAGQTLKMNVSVRGVGSWYVGTLCITLGAVIWWLATVWIARIRQEAGNQILVARLQVLLNNLADILGRDASEGMPPASQTDAHIDVLRKDKLRQLLRDKALAVVAGVTIPAIGTVPVLDEIEGVNRVVQRGFANLFALWKQNPASQPQLAPFFLQMDTLGAATKQLSDVDQSIKDILAAAQTAATGKKLLAQDLSFSSLPSENVIVHRVLFSTYLLDLVAIATIVALGVFVLIVRNLGYGSPSDLMIAFFWGLGLKLGTDAARLGPGDVRNAFAIKIPAATP